MKNEDPRSEEESPDQLTEAELERTCGARRTKNASEHRLPDLDPKMFGSGS